MNQQILFFPIEIQNRELDFRLFLAAYCARAGRRVFIGQHDVIYRLARRSQNGVYVGKNLFRSLFPSCELDRYQAVKANGFSLVHLDEEGLPFEREQQQRNEYLLTRLDPRVLNEDDWACTWGDEERDCYREIARAHRERIVTTGRPRFDLCTPQYRDFYRDTVQQLHTQHSEFLLLNTNFTYQASLPDARDTFSAAMGFNAQDDAARLRFVEHWAHLNKVRTDFVRLANRLSVDFPQLTIVLRPHPAESLDFYKLVLGQVKNVVVTHRGSVLPWLMAARAVIHNGCTTATEAHFAGTPVITFNTVADGFVDYTVANAVGLPCSNQQQVLDAVRDIMENRVTSVAPPQQLATQLLNNFREPSFPLLCEIIERALHAKDAASCDFPAFKKEHRARQRLLKAKKTLRKISPVKKQHQQKSLSHSPQILKFPGLQISEIDEKLTRIQTMLKKPLRWKLHDETLISVEADSA